MKLYKNRSTYCLLTLYIHNRYLNLLNSLLTNKYAFSQTKYRNTLCVFALTIRVYIGKWWGTRTQQPILALHGWQDNAGTFDRLCPLLPANQSVLCIDLPGHGQSTHYPIGMQYFLFWDGIAVIRRIVKHYNWQNKVTLMGHSLGGALAFMYAASFPDEVHRLISIDMAGPAVRDLQRTAAGTGAAIDRALKYETLHPSKVPCYEYNEMIDIVVEAHAGSVDRIGAEALMRRGMHEVIPQNGKQDGATPIYHFSRDLRLKVSALGMFTLDQVLSYAKQITCEVLNIRGRPGMKFDNDSAYMTILEATRTNASRVVYEEVEGTHHLHLTTPERVVPFIKAFLNNSSNST